MAHRPTPRRDPRTNARLVDHLARENYRFLCAVAYRAGVEPQDVDDVVQAALLDVLRSFPGPNEMGHVAAYAARCVQNQAWKRRRRHARKESRNVPPPQRERSDRLGTSEEVGLSDPGQSGPLERAMSTEASQEARRRLESLPDDQRTVLLLGAAGFSTEEIAERMGLSVRAVRKRVEKANRRLRELAEGAQ